MLGTDKLRALFDRAAPVSPTSYLERRLEIPSTHTVPLTWLHEAASLPIQYRTLTEVVPEQSRDMERVAVLREEIVRYKESLAIIRKQKDTGLWGGNLLAPAPSKALGWKEVGTIFQYRRLLELGWPPDGRPFRFADRFLFRLLSRDDDPSLLVEFQRAAKTDPGLGLWARSMGAQAAAAALARGAHQDDPRLRGAAHRVASDISMYLRSEVAQKPFKKAQGKTVLDPLAYPPTVFSVEMLAFMPAVQRERAGFLERLAAYFSIPTPRRAFAILAGKKTIPPLFEILGDPLHADAQGRITDVPFALYWLELLARLGIVRHVPSAAKVLARLYSETDDQGVWSPAGLRVTPKSTNPVVSHYFPLEGPGKSPAQRQTDVTFRLALIARLLGMPLNIV